MTQTMKMFKKGQVVIPAQFRKMMHLEVDSLVDIEYDEENDVFILSECELLEASLVSIPANPFALAKELGNLDVESKDVSLTDEQRKSVQDAFNVLKSLIDTDNEFKATDKIAESTKKSPSNQPNKASVLKAKKGKAKHILNKTLRKLAK